MHDTVRLVEHANTLHTDIGRVIARLEEVTPDDYLDRATRAAIRDAQDLYGNAINHISKALDAPHHQEYLVRGLGVSSTRGAPKPRSATPSELWVDLGTLASASGRRHPMTDLDLFGNPVTQQPAPALHPVVVAVLPAVPHRRPLPPGPVDRSP